MEDAVRIAKSVELGSRDAVELNDNRDARSVHPSVDHAEIVVVRHGQTDWNVDYRIQGHLDVKLNEVGRQQTRAVADRLSKEREISTIYSSDLKRAIETTEVIAATCGVREGGESKDQVYRRCTSCLQNIGLKHKGGRVVVVTHGTVHRSIYRQARPNEGPAPKVQNGSISILHLFSRDDWVIKSWGDHSHLNQTEEKL
ncbi:phosphoglycerate mutase-like protein 4 isoform X2 [Eucalyptus grandis]|uniref:phosphoglycerate mutase-like protein 4 isoform X2 n=1 Tax=Eucalyptus grandis TaxID=71139 RepID=UPI00192EAB90|nr:phosphoglycerate mutase-like protein 4 isoform X2 [Eucalyptus grandis]